MGFGDVFWLLVERLAGDLHIFISDRGVAKCVTEIAEDKNKKVMEGTNYLFVSRENGPINYNIFPGVISRTPVKNGVRAEGEGLGGEGRLRHDCRGDGRVVATVVRSDTMGERTCALVQRCLWQAYAYRLQL